MLWVHSEKQLPLLPLPLLMRLCLYQMELLIPGACLKRVSDGQEGKKLCFSHCHLITWIFRCNAAPPTIMPSDRFPLSWVREPLLTVSSVVSFLLFIFIFFFLDKAAAL